MKKILRFIQYILSVLFVLMGIGQFAAGSALPGLFLSLLGVLIFPKVLDIIRYAPGLRNNLLRNGLFVGLFVAALATTPPAAPESEVTPTPTSLPSPPPTEAVLLPGEGEELITITITPSATVTVSIAPTATVVPTATTAPSPTPSATPSPKPVAGPSSKLTVTFLDVGQGDCTLLECDGEYMLIDGGDAEASSYVVSYLKRNTAVGSAGIRYLLATHYDADHISGLVGCLSAFTVDTVICPSDYGEDTRTYRSFADKLVGKNVYFSPTPGTTFSLGSATITILGPFRQSNYDVNDNSLIVRVDHGENSYLFTGDAGVEVENDLLDEYTEQQLMCDVFHAGHHGSGTSNGKAFLDVISPAHTVISCGTNNEYGHPHDNVLKRFYALDSLVYRTDMQGEIVCVSDGTKLTFSVAAVPYAPPTPTPTSKPTKAPTATPTIPDKNLPGGGGGRDFVLNTNTMKYHEPSCSSVKTIADKNRQDYNGTASELEQRGYSPCGRCH